MRLRVRNARARQYTRYGVIVQQDSAQRSTREMTRRVSYARWDFARSFVAALLCITCFGVGTLAITHGANNGGSDSESSTSSPVIAITLPGDGETLAATVTVTAAVTCGSGDTVELVVGGVRVTTVASSGSGSVSVSFDTRAFRNGVTTLAVRLRNAKREILATDSIEIFILN